MMKYYSAIKRNEILIHATTWMNLENIMPSEINHTQKEKNCIIPLICICRIGKFTDTEARTEVARGWGEGGMGSHCLMGTVSIWDDEKCSESG